MGVTAATPPDADAVYADRIMAVALTQEDGQWGVWWTDGPRTAFEPVGTYEDASREFSQAVQDHLNQPA